MKQKLQNQKYFEEHIKNSQLHIYSKAPVYVCLKYLRWNYKIENKLITKFL